MTNLHTKVEGFGLTLERKALSWFQTLKMTQYHPTFDALEKDFVIVFSKMGLKHNVLLQIHGFKQMSKETMRYCANHLRKYLLRCPIEETPIQEVNSINLFGRPLK